MSIKKIKKLSQGFVLVMLLTVSSFACAEWQNEYEIEGYDLVSYFQGDGPKLGDPRYSLMYGGLNYAFSSMENLDEFSLDPERFVPAYDGNCAFGMVYGKQSHVDPLVWEIVDDRLFLLINHSTKKRWNRKNTKYIKRGDKSWKRFLANQG